MLCYLLKIKRASENAYHFIFDGEEIWFAVCREIMNCEIMNSEIIGE